MTHFFFLVVFFLSLLFLPWWASVFLAVVGVAYFQTYVSVVLGGIILDTVFSTPVPAVFDISYIYTLVFIILAILAFGIRQFILE